ncbi:hypothetical protein V8C86DRAFT_941440 [Haematococcus lacustris]
MNPRQFRSQTPGVPLQPQGGASSQPALQQGMPMMPARQQLGYQHAGPYMAAPGSSYPGMQPQPGAGQGYTPVPSQTYGPGPPGPGSVSPHPQPLTQRPAAAEGGGTPPEEAMQFQSFLSVFEQPSQAEPPPDPAYGAPPQQPAYRHLQQPMAQQPHLGRGLAPPQPAQQQQQQQQQAAAGGPQHQQLYMGQGPPLTQHPAMGYMPVPPPPGPLTHPNALEGSGGPGAAGLGPPGPGPLQAPPGRPALQRPPPGPGPGPGPRGPGTDPILQQLQQLGAAPAPVAGAQGQASSPAPTGPEEGLGPLAAASPLDAQLSPEQANKVYWERQGRLRERYLHVLGTYLINSIQSRQAKTQQGQAITPQAQSRFMSQLESLFDAYKLLNRTPGDGQGPEPPGVRELASLAYCEERWLKLLMPVLSRMTHMTTKLPNPTSIIAFVQRFLASMGGSSTPPPGPPQPALLSTAAALPSPALSAPSPAPPPQSGHQGRAPPLAPPPADGSRPGSTPLTTPEAVGGDMRPGPGQPGRGPPPPSSAGPQQGGSQARVLQAGDAPQAPAGGGVQEQGEEEARKVGAGGAAAALPLVQRQAVTPPLPAWVMAQTYLAAGPRGEGGGRGAPRLSTAGLRGAVSPCIGHCWLLQDRVGGQGAGQGLGPGLRQPASPSPSPSQASSGQEGEWEESDSSGEGVDSEPLVGGGTGAPGAARDPQPPGPGTPPLSEVGRGVKRARSLAAQVAALESVCAAVVAAAAVRWPDLPPLLLQVEGPGSGAGSCPLGPSWLLVRCRAPGGTTGGAAQREGTGQGQAAVAAAAWAVVAQPGWRTLHLAVLRRALALEPAGGGGEGRDAAGGQEGGWEAAGEEAVVVALHGLREPSCAPHSPEEQLAQAAFQALQAAQAARGSGPATPALGATSRLAGEGANTAAGRVGAELWGLVGAWVEAVVGLRQQAARGIDVVVGRSRRS